MDTLPVQLHGDARDETHYRSKYEHPYPIANDSEDTLSNSKTLFRRIHVRGKSKNDLEIDKTDRDMDNFLIDETFEVLDDDGEEEQDEVQLDKFMREIEKKELDLALQDDGLEQFERDDEFEKTIIADEPADEDEDGRPKFHGDDGEISGGKFKDWNH